MPYHYDSQADIQGRRRKQQVDVPEPMAAEEGIHHKRTNINCLCFSRSLFCVAGGLTLKPASEGAWQTGSSSLLGGGSLNSLALVGLPKRSAH